MRSNDALFAEVAAFGGKRDPSLGRELSPPFLSLVSKARRLDDGVRVPNQLVVEGCRCDKFVHLKEGHPGGAFGRRKSSG